MRCGKVEKIDVRSDYFSGGGRRYLKRRTNKLIRRLGREYLDEGPRRVRDVTRGWVS